MDILQPLDLVGEEEIGVDPAVLGEGLGPVGSGEVDLEPGHVVGVGFERGERAGDNGAQEGFGLIGALALDEGKAVVDAGGGGVGFLGHELHGEADGLIGLGAPDEEDSGVIIDGDEVVGDEEVLLLSRLEHELEILDGVGSGEDQGPVMGIAAEVGLLADEELAGIALVAEQDQLLADVEDELGIAELEIGELAHGVIGIDVALHGHGGSAVEEIGEAGEGIGEAADFAELEGELGKGVPLLILDQEAGELEPELFGVAESGRIALVDEPGMIPQAEESVDIGELGGFEGGGWGESVELGEADCLVMAAGVGEEPPVAGMFEGGVEAAVAELAQGGVAFLDAGAFEADEELEAEGLIVEGGAGEGFVENLAGVEGAGGGAPAEGVGGVIEIELWILAEERPLFFPAVGEAAHVAGKKERLEVDRLEGGRE